jgi:hypothetical protein
MHRILQFDAWAVYYELALLFDEVVTVTLRRYTNANLKRINADRHEHP